MSEEVELVQTQEVSIYDAGDKASIDVQVATAKSYPRNVNRAVNNSIAIVTLDKEIAESSNYSLPRGGKNISGPSVHLARIIAQNWGNLRVESKVVAITANQIVSQAVCFDLETNYAVKVETRKSIVGKNGKFNDDMITVTGNATNAIAYRNAVFAVVPKGVVDKVYKAALNMITGDLSSEEKLIKRRSEAMKHFKDTYEVTESQILEVLGLNSINQIKQDEIVRLVGLAQALKDGDTTVSDTFGKTKVETDKKGANKVDQIMSDLDKVKNKKNVPIEPENKAENVTFSTEDEARAFFTNDFGIMPQNLEGKNLYSTATELGFNLKIG